MFNRLVIAGIACVTLMSYSGCSKPPETQSSGEPQGAISSLPLLGYVDVPADGATLNGELAIGGWAIWGERVSAIQLLLDGTRIGGDFQMEIARPDVAKIHPEYHNGNSGWGAPLINIAAFPLGKHRLTVLAVSSTGKTQEIKTFTVTFARP